MDDKLLEQILREAEQQPGPVVGERIAAAGGLLYYGMMPYFPGLPTGKEPAEIRQMAIKLAAMCVKLAMDTTTGGSGA